MTSIDIFNNLEYLLGNVYSYNNTKVISMINPNDLSFVSYTAMPKSGGCCVRFITNSPKIKIIYSITDPLIGNFPHIGISAQRGLSCSYRRIKEKYWRNIDGVNSRENTGEITIESHRWIPNSEYYEMAVYLPINCFITHLEILIEENATIQSGKNMLNRKIMLLGGTDSYGIGITGTQFQLSNLLSRHIANSYITNISFNSNNLWSIYKQVITLIPELNQQDLFLLEIPILQEYTSENKKDVFDFIASLCERVNGKIAIWHKPCFEHIYLKSSPFWENIISEIDLKYEPVNKIFFNDSFLIKNNHEYDMYMSSGKFINDNGSIFIMRKVVELAEDLWNT